MSNQIDVQTRLKTARGHLEGVTEMVKADRSCLEVMKQISAIRGALEQANRVLLRSHLDEMVCRSAPDKAAGVVAELMEAMKYTAAATRPAPWKNEELT